jgi:NTP pyrophosphatase (non-canonical NTP hydrolase)
MPVKKRSQKAGVVRSANVSRGRGLARPDSAASDVPPPVLGKLTPTPVYDTYWRFAAERQDVFFRRLEGRPAPWTHDPVLQVHKFTNAYRASDRVSQYLIRSVIYAPDLPADATEVVFRVLLFKLFNKIETWELLTKALGSLTWSEFSFKHYDRVLSRVLGRRQPIYSAAYIMPSGGPNGHDRKHRTHLALLEQMMREGLPDRLAGAASMRQAFELLRGYPTIGDFLAYQYVTDINYSEVTDFTETEFVAPGPGAIDGIRKCFSSTGGVSDAEVIHLVTERQEAEFHRLGIDFKTLWGRRLQMIDCQNLFCEVDKYARVVHPNVSGRSGRTRIKQKFSPNTQTIEYWYPPKWGINDLVARHPIRRAATTPDLFTSISEESMDLRTYQARVTRTDRNPGTDEQARMIPLAGLASETGELLGEYKKYLRDGASHRLFKERLSEEVGDLLWYVANVATKFGLDLDEVAQQNLEKCEGRWGGLPSREAFDIRFPKEERFPRQFSIDFLTYHDENGAPKIRVMYKGKQFGDDLNDNAHTPDGYGYHDVIHLAFAAVLGWSPLVRKMLNAKRKSDASVDLVEDGGRAIATEEGLSTMVFAFARDYAFLEGKSSLSTELLRTLRNMVSHLEVAACTAGEWEHAIIEGFKVWREIKRRAGGTVDLDLDQRTIRVRGA